MIINTFISDGQKIPEYTLLSLKRLRDLNPDERILFICSTTEPYGSFFKKNRIEVMEQNQIESDLLLEFNEISNLKRHGTPNTTYPSPDFFFHRAMERIYYLEAVIWENDYKNVWHFENDVLTYYPLPDQDDELKITMMGAGIATFAVVYIPLAKNLTYICNEFNKLLCENEADLMNKYKIDMVNEMTLLAILNQRSFPILPPPPFDENYLFDPGSYGQYLGGTNNGHGSGYAGDHHFIGRFINKGYIKPVFENGKPWVLELDTGEQNALFNLHIHSKKLEQFL